ncbi:MAG TPA: UDP-2,3-diacylglucosamine diphosphatase [Symbiobacteriaceae bacterium]|nr:UDP-2,3-diacylglucosamine diphosphatase [Symbiobacteriaceae bacterium]
MVDEVIYFVSDTHLGDGTGADRFIYHNQLVDLLSRIEQEPQAQLVLLGDVMELWATALEPVLVRYASIFEMVGRLAATRPVTYIVGNHDCLPWYYFVGQGAGNIRIAEQFTAARGALVALHGHQYDPFNQIKVTEGHVKVPWVRRLVQAMGFLGRVGGQATSDAIADAAAAIEKAAGSLETLLPSWDNASRSALGGVLQRTQGVLLRESPGERGYPKGEAAYEEGARALMRKGARFVVMGHTHHPLVHTYGNRVYVNTGSWVWDRYPPTYARYASGRLELLDANTHQPYVAQE